METTQRVTVGTTHSVTRLNARQRDTSCHGGHNVQHEGAQEPIAEVKVDQVAGGANVQHRLGGARNSSVSSSSSSSS